MVNEQIISIISEEIIEKGDCSPPSWEFDLNIDHLNIAYRCFIVKKVQPIFLLSSPPSDTLRMPVRYRSVMYKYRFSAFTSRSIYTAAVRVQSAIRR